MKPNTNPETGIRYGIISSRSLNDDVVNEMYQVGKDVHFTDAQEEITEGLERVLGDFMSDDSIERVTKLAIEEMSNDFNDDEPVYEGTLDGVNFRTTWLGGALLVYIFESPITTYAKLCSPCVPNCGDLDNLEAMCDGGYECYGVPDSWRADCLTPEEN